MLPEIYDAIASGRIATICCLDAGRPYCFHCFYAYQESSSLLLFRSAPGAHPAGLLNHGNPVAGTILPPSARFSARQGIRFLGTVGPAPAESRAYFGAVFPSEDPAGDFYGIRMTRIKMIGDPDRSPVSGQPLATS